MRTQKNLEHMMNHQGPKKVRTGPRLEEGFTPKIKSLQEEKRKKSL